jgi:hypothetical protein
MIAGRAAYLKGSTPDLRQEVTMPKYAEVDYSELGEGTTTTSWGGMPCHAYARSH